MSTRPILVCLLLFFCLTAPCRAERRVLHAKMTHLRSGERREWQSFPLKAEGDRLQVDFRSAANSKPWTIGLRRVDVKLFWQVLLNGKQLARLNSDENDISEAFEVPSGGIREGANRLTVQTSNKREDDIRVGQVWLEERPKSEIYKQARLTVEVDERGVPSPCRITILDRDGSMPPLGVEPNDALAVRNGVVYSSTGKATIGLAPGEYTVYAGRGFEYSLASTTVRLAAGDEMARKLTVSRVVETPGLVSCDTHVHTFTYSRHGDATISERMVTLAGEGIELPIATDHNLHIDYEQPARKLHARRFFTPVIGNEVTTKLGHFNVFPIRAATVKPPNHKADNWPEIFKSIFATDDVKLAILNHGRDLHGGFRPFDETHHNSLVGEHSNGWKLRANAMEIINSAALQSDPMPLVRDWFGLLSRGRSVCPIGSSDSHEVSRKIVGQGRTYIRCADEDPSKIDVDRAVASLLAGRVSVSLGLLADITVDDQFHAGDLVICGQEVAVRVQVKGPEWTLAKRVELYANGVLVRHETIPEESGREAGVKWTSEWKLKRPKHDLHLVAIARGPGVDQLYWPIAKPYQPTSDKWESYVFSMTGPVRLDANGDGRWTSPHEYAKRVHDEAPRDFGRLFKSLSDYDQVVAAHVAERLATSGVTLLNPKLAAALANAAPDTKTGFQRHFKAWRQTQAR